MAAYLLGLDSGLTVTKAVVFRDDGSVVAVTRREIRQIKSTPRHVERDMAEHWSISAEAIRAALAAASEAEGAPVRPLAVAVAGHGDGVYLVDAAGAPLGLAATSLDSRAQGVVAEWDAAGISERALALTGQLPFPASPAPILAHLKRVEPERYARIGAILSCKDWLRYGLTGRIATDFTEASVAFTDVWSQSYSTEALDLFGLPELAHALPPVFAPGAVAGQVTARAAAETGLAEGTPVAAGLHDVTACAAGAGVVGPGMIAVIAGTYSINEMMTSSPAVAPGWHTRSGLAPGLWMNMSVSPASSANLDWFIQQSARDALTLADPFAVLQGELDAVADDPSEIVYLPYLYGSPHREDVPAAFFGLRGWHHRGHMLRAVAEGIVFNHRHHVDLLDPSAKIDRVRLTGGSSRNAYFCQLFADALNRRIEVPATEEAGALGAAMSAGIAAGRFAGWADAARQVHSDVVVYEPGPRTTVLGKAYDRYRDAARSLLTRNGTDRS